MPSTQPHPGRGAGARSLASRGHRPATGRRGRRGPPTGRRASSSPPAPARWSSSASVEAIEQGEQHDQPEHGHDGAARPQPDGDPAVVPREMSERIGDPATTFFPRIARIPSVLERRSGPAAAEQATRTAVRAMHAARVVPRLDAPPRRVHAVRPAKHAPSMALSHEPESQRRPRGTRRTSQDPWERIVQEECDGFAVTRRAASAWPMSRRARPSSTTKRTCPCACRRTPPVTAGRGP